MSLATLTQVARTAIPTIPPAPTATPPPAPTPLPVPAGALRVTVSPAQASAGECVTVTVQVRADAALTDALVQSVLPVGLIFRSASDPAARYVSAERTLYWPLAHVASGATAELRLSLCVGDDAPDLLVQRFDLRARGASLATERVTLRRTFPPSESDITPERGGELRSADGRVRVLFPAGAVTETLRVEHRPLSVKALQPGGSGMALTFELNAFHRTPLSEPVHTFAVSVEVQVDMAGLVDWEALAFYQYPMLGYWDAQTSKWVELPTRRQGDVLTTHLTHFSILGGGSGNNEKTGWALVFNDAQVALFSGAAIYSYPIEVPEGRGGLTPDLHLDYNSRRIDGILTWIQTDWVGLGWTLDTMEIVRSSMHPDYSLDINRHPAWWSGGVGWQPNEFTLLYKGTGYKLKPDPNMSRAAGRYYTEDEQFLYVERRNATGGNGRPANATGEYWVVRLRDGTEYRLGYYGNTRDQTPGNSEQVVRASDYTPSMTPETESQYGGVCTNTIAFRWRVDQIQDRVGNTMVFTYTEEVSTYGGDWREKASYLKNIYYNSYNCSGATCDYGTLITFTTMTRGEAPDNTQVTDKDGFGEWDAFFGETKALRSIQIGQWDGNAYSLIREYVLTYTTQLGDNCGTYHNHTRLLEEIGEYGIGGLAANRRLPSTRFGYWQHQNKPATGSSGWEGTTYCYSRLRDIYNGYNGKIELEYDTPDTGINPAQYNYRVAKKIAEDEGHLWGMGSIITYTYSSDRCYDSNGNRICRTSATDGSLVGYRYVTESLHTVAGVTLTVSHHEFKLNSEADPDKRLGRELVSVRRDASGADLQRTNTTWATETIAPANTCFVYASAVEEYTREGSGLSGTPQKKAEYLYQPGYQGGAQYGNLTQVNEYKNGVFYGKTIYTYYPLSTTMWIVGLLAKTEVFDNADWLQSKTVNVYDNNPGGNYAPLRGNVTAVWQFKDGSDDTYPTQLITYTTVYSLPMEVSDGNGHRTRTEYDAYGLYPLTVTNALTQVTTYAYDRALGKVTKATGPNGADTATTYGYDDWGRLVTATQPYDPGSLPSVRYEYSDATAPFQAPLRIITYQRVASSPDATIPTRRFYNGLGQLIQENVGTTDQSSMSVTSYTYNALGLQEDVYLPYTCTFAAGYVTPDPSKPKTHYDYDALGRVTTVTQSDGTQTRTQYDGFRQAVLDANGHQKVYENNPLGRLVRVREYAGTYANPDVNATPAYATTSYAYNRLDLLTTVTDTLGNVISMTYNLLGQKTGMHDPDMGAWSYSYDKAGNLQTQTDARGQRLCFYYDPLNRLLGKYYTTTLTYPASPPTYNVRYTYDGAYSGNYGLGLRTSMTDVSGSTRWRYDARGRVISETKVIDGVGGGAFSTLWSYDSRDQMVSRSYPASPIGETGETATTTYDVWGRPYSLGSSGNNRPSVISATYDFLGRPTGMRLGNGNQTLWDYYPLNEQGGRLKAIRTGVVGGDPTTTQYLTYTYDAVGNVTILTDHRNSDQTQRFAYDALDRLTQAYTPTVGGAAPYSITYTYDEIGNLTQVYTPTLTRYEYPCGVGHRVAAGQNHALSYWYDQNGNMVKRLVNGATYTLTYDAENRLTGVAGSNGTSASFVYDGDGQRVKSTINGVSTAYIGDLYEYNGFSTRYYLFNGRRVGMSTQNEFFSEPLAYLYADHLNSTVKATGDLPGSQYYYPYGAQRGADVVPTDRCYTGQRWEEEIGLYDYGARWYDAALGRFIQPDTIVPDPGNPQSLNRYSYCLNNPMNYTDPSGYDPLDAAWEGEFARKHGGHEPNDQDRRDRLFSLLYPGRGPGGDWTKDDWTEYGSHRAEYWGKRPWSGASAPGLDRFVKHLNRLASYYVSGEENLYAQAIGFVWGGVPLGHAVFAAWQMASNPGAAWSVYPPLFEGTENWDPALLDDDNPSHHYAGLFYMGYFFGSLIGDSSNWLRDGPLSDISVPDLNLGYLAVSQGAMLCDGIISMGEVGLAVSYAMDARLGLWPANTPGRRTPWYYPQPWVR